MKYILTIDDDEALCKLVKKCIETAQVPVYTFLRGGGCAFLLLSESE